MKPGIPAGVAIPAAFAGAPFHAEQDLDSATVTVNFIPFNPFSGFETVGASEFVNYMLLQSDPGDDSGAGRFLGLFEAWPQTMDASFTRLPGRGAFVVSSSFDKATKSVGATTIASGRGGDCVGQPAVGVGVGGPAKRKPAAAVHGGGPGDPAVSVVNTATMCCLRFGDRLADDDRADVQRRLQAWARQ